MGSRRQGREAAIPRGERPAARGTLRGVEHGPGLFHQPGPDREFPLIPPALAQHDPGDRCERAERTQKHNQRKQATHGDIVLSRVVPLQKGD